MEELTNSGKKQYVAFNLGNEEYGIDIQKVTTIEKLLSIARVPRTQKFIKGVINLRGEIITVIDLRKKFNLPEVEATEDTKIIIIKTEEYTAGIIVDSVAEVFDLNDEDFESINNFSNDLTMDYILGVGKVNNRIITLINLEQLIKSSF